ncbi:MAG: fluoride efflux transporter CrcB [Betaproteobacteria bacterium]|nr:fluoride efflux transporter CrcB [Betaproteobacteria bacterium]
MNAAIFAAIGVGAACGAWLRWALGEWLNPSGFALPLGTLAANLGGGFLIGVTLAVLQNWPGLSPVLRLGIVTGLLGGLTTFSTFSAEAFHLVQRGQWGWMAAHTLLHVVGSILLTWLGYALVQAQWKG